MTEREIVTRFKLRQDWFETPMGSYGYRQEAADACRKNDLDPDAIIVHRVEMTPVKALLKALNAHLQACGLSADEYDFCLAPHYRDDATMRGWNEEQEQAGPLIPQRYRWLIAYAVEGDNEGYYVHVGAISKGDSPNLRQITTYEDFGFCKTYSAESAYNIAREAQRFLTTAAWN